MKVKLISHTDSALELLIYTKNTRLQGGMTLEDIIRWPDEKKIEHFEYMIDTIQSSFEFVDYTFKISEVPRSFTHQLVRTRTGSYAQESMRTIDARSAACDHPDMAQSAVDEIFSMYAHMIDIGVQIQDAREILPTGVHTSIIAKFNLRTIHDMALVRLCTRTSGIYQDVFKEMKKEICKVHPWAEEFIRVHCSWYGTCAFPRYKECPVQELTIDRIMGKKLNIIKENCNNMINEINHVANPVAKNGVTQ